MGILIDTSTTALLGMALDAATLRQQAIAQNIANANSPGYRAHQVRFEEQFDEIKSQLAQGRSPAITDLAGYRPSIETAEEQEASPSLDMQVAKLAENTLHHQALLKVLNRQISIISAAISEGKR